MQERKAEYPNWFLWLWEKGFLVGIGIGLIITLILLVSAYYLDQRLAGIEERMAYEPTRRYEPPDLDAREAKDIALESIVLERAVYVPVYSHVYHNQGRPYLLEATLSVRNTDQTRPISVTSVRYYDTKGTMLEDFLKTPLQLAPLESAELLVEKKDKRGGAGANFIVEWSASQKVNEPIIEAVMVGIHGSGNISFVTHGRAISKQSDEPAP